MTIEDAWSTYHSRMKAIGARITEPDFPDDARLRVEGFRYLARLQEFALQWYLEFSDPVHPAFFRFGDDVLKWGSTNADNQYVRAKVEPGGVYRIRGPLNGVKEILISLHDGEMVLGQTAVLAERSLDELTVGPDGILELFLGGPEREVNWLPIDPSADLVLVRQFVADWEHDGIAELQIERLDELGQVPPSEPTAMVLADAFDRAATWVERSAEFWNHFTTMRQQATTENEIGPPGQAAAGAVNMLSGSCWWDLGPGEALLIECDVPDAAYWSVQLSADAWFEPLDFVNRVTSLNNRQIHIDNDGRFRVVVAHEDPGIQNWLDTTGYQCGVVVYRWVKAKDAPVPTSEVVKISELPLKLPVSDPAFSVSDRRTQIGARRAGAARRFRR